MTDMLQPIPPGDQPANDRDGARRRNGAPPPPPTFPDDMPAGDKLAARREQLGLSLEQVADRIRVNVTYLEALEAMNAKLLPGRAYAVAYLRSYVRALGLEEEALVAQYQDECFLSREDDRPQLRSPRTRPHRERPWIAAAVLGVVAGGFVAWRTLGPAPASTAPDAVVEAPAGEIGAGAYSHVSREAMTLRTLEIRAIREARLEVRGADGTVFFYDTLAPGQAYRPDPAPDWTLHAQDGGAFMLYMGGVEIEPLGEDGAPVLGRRVSDIPLPDENNWARAQ